jgi:hypothetical protein
LRVIQFKTKTVGPDSTLSWQLDEDLVLVAAGGFGRSVISISGLTWNQFFAYASDVVTEDFQFGTTWSAPPSADGSTANNVLSFLRFEFLKGQKIFVSPETSGAAIALFFISPTELLSQLGP